MAPDASRLAAVLADPKAEAIRSRLNARFTASVFARQELLDRLTEFAAAIPDASDRLRRDTPMIPIADEKGLAAVWKMLAEKHGIHSLPLADILCTYADAACASEAKEP